MKNKTERNALIQFIKSHLKFISIQILEEADTKELKSLKKDIEHGKAYRRKII